MENNNQIYFNTFSQTVKGAWWNKKLLDFLNERYSVRDSNYYIEAIRIGVVKINNKIVDIDYVLKANDTIQHKVHCHEPVPIEIPIIYKEKDFIIVNKPSGIACHPTTGYFYFSITELLKDYGRLSCINRLDVPTSGVLILCINNPDKYHKMIKNGKIKKTYVAKVKGKFIDEITVNKNIEKTLTNKNFISENGKEAITEFKLLTYKNGHSLVECRPITGRSHQIRVHLQYLGYPIVNDLIYSENKEYFFEYEECKTKGENYEEEFILKNCRGTNTKAFKNLHYDLFLHAYRYEINGTVYEAPLPNWAEEFLK
ncbi:Pseudouridine synthase protein [Spraguea lophii 42_110]|uniref:Pseudouridine synthase n=1 Tax=Spraguea lophii (strain 42_110) TaxID=1358809 RepID=S7XV76_SPRLO|nr:Pseudouridine synthase protein [Spraguea lophii 42_110]